MAQEFFLTPPNLMLLNNGSFISKNFKFNQEDSILNVGCNTGKADLFSLIFTRISES